MEKQWYEIILECKNNPTSAVTKEVVARVKSKGLAYIIYQKLQDVYQGSPSTECRVYIAK